MRVASRKSQHAPLQIRALPTHWRPRSPSTTTLEESPGSKANVSPRSIHVHDTTLSKEGVDSPLKGDAVVGNCVCG